MIDPNIKGPQQSPHFPDSFYRISVKGLYVQNGKVLLCKDRSLIGREAIWELPGGGLDFGEAIPDALRREVKEEMGLTVTSVADTPTYAWTHRKENSRGMEWWYTLLLAYRFDVQSLQDFTPTDEALELQFFSRQELAQAIKPFQQMYRFVDLFNPNDFV